MSKPNRLWILGAPDPEMAAIERLLTECGEQVFYAVDGAGDRVHPGNAYKAVGFVSPDGETFGDATRADTYLVECDVARRGFGRGVMLVHIDHHRPSDFGYGRSPEDFLKASSIGQVLCYLSQGGRLPEAALTGNGVGDIGRAMVPGEILFDGERWRIAVGNEAGWLADDLVLVAAADHCLAAAYRGECPGVDPDALMRWRVASRAEFQGRPAEELLADVEKARRVLREGAAELQGGYHCARCGYSEANAAGTHCNHCDPFVVDLRSLWFIPELPEAAVREQIPFLATVTDRDGRDKVVLQAAPEGLVKDFLAGRIVEGLVDMYGDPARGFAGGYKA